MQNKRIKNLQLAISELSIKLEEVGRAIKLLSGQIAELEEFSESWANADELIEEAEDDIIKKLLNGLYYTMLQVRKMQDPSILLDEEAEKKFEDLFLFIKEACWSEIYKLPCELKKEF